MDVGVNSNDPFWWNPVSHAGGRQCVRPSQERETSVNSDRGGGDEGDGDEGDGDVVTMAMRVRVMANGVF